MSTPKRPKRSRDPNTRAYEIVQESTAERPFPKTVPLDELPEPAAEAPKPEPEADEGKNPHAVALGRMGGAKGGKARAEKLSKRKRSEIARKAAEARWKRPKSNYGTSNP